MRQPVPYSRHLRSLVQVNKWLTQQGPSTVCTNKGASNDRDLLGFNLVRTVDDMDEDDDDSVTVIQKTPVLRDHIPLRGTSPNQPLGTLTADSKNACHTSQNCGHSRPQIERGSLKGLISRPNFGGSESTTSNDLWSDNDGERSTPPSSDDENDCDNDDQTRLDSNRQASTHEQLKSVEFDQCNEEDSSSDSDGSISDEDEGEDLIKAVYKQERNMGRKYVYHGQDVDNIQHNTEDGPSLAHIIEKMVEPHDSYDCAIHMIKMSKVKSKSNNNDVQSFQRCIYYEVQKLVDKYLTSKSEKINAIFALAGQLVRAGIFQPSIVASLISSMESELHTHFPAIKILIQYAGPEIYMSETLNATENILEKLKSLEHSNNECQSIYPKIERFVKLYKLRMSYLGDERRKLGLDELGKRMREIDDTASTANSI